MKLTPESHARKLLKSDQTLNVHRYCSGKYDWSKRASITAYADLTAYEGIVSIFLSRRTDRDGVYGRLMCLSRKPL